MSATDPRFQFGAKVKAIHVTSQIECHRRYGSNAKTKFVNGVVCRVDTTPSSGKKRAVTLITANYYLGGNTIKTTVLNSRSVKAGHVTSIPNEGNGLGTESVNQNSVAVAATNPTSAAPEVNDPNPTPLNINENNVSEIVAPAGFAVGAEEFPQEDVEEQAGTEHDNIAVSPQIVATVHGMEWVRASTNDLPLNGNVAECGASAVMFWFLEEIELQHKIFRRSNFLLLFPPKQLSDMVHWTNVELNKASLKETTAKRGPQILWHPHSHDKI
ncbi:Transposase IS4 [Fragilaria crotonensis]|nr:Transposase IS4 [Fragilaria crotonensis]